MSNKAYKRALPGYETVARVAEVTGISRSTLWRWIKDGELATSDGLVGNVRMVSLASLREKMGDAVFEGYQW